MGLNDWPIQAQCWETFRPHKSGPERLGPEWLGLNCGHPFKEMNIGINTNIYFSISEKLKRTTSSLPLPSGMQIGIASSSFMSMEEFRKANWHMLPDGLTCQRCFANFHSLRRHVKSGTQICIHCYNYDFHRYITPKRVSTEYYLFYFSVLDFVFQIKSKSANDLDVIWFET